MSQTSKLVLGAAIVAVILIAGFYFWQMQRKSAPVGSSASNSAEVTTLPTGSSTSDSSIEQDLSAIDSQLKGVQSDNQAASASVNSSVSQ